MTPISTDDNPNLETVHPASLHPDAPNACAVITPAGRGAVAVIATFGETVDQVIDELFISASRTKVFNNRRQSVFYGVWKSTGEDVVLVRSPDGRLEIHCHGGDSASAAIVTSLVEARFSSLTRKEAALRIHRGDWKSDVAAGMSRALTEKTALILLQQYSMVDQKLKELAELVASDCSAALAELKLMNQWARFGTQLTVPRSVVFCGSPNVGKSSLVNAIVGFNRAIVHETAGTTRDVVAQITAIDGWPVEIKDTAGLREATNPIEEIGIDLSHQEIRSADLVVFVLDAANAQSTVDIDLASTQTPTLIVVNKIDLIDDLATESSRFPAGTLYASAKSNEGIAALTHQIGNIFQQKPPSNLLFPMNHQQANTIVTAIDFIKSRQPDKTIQLLQQLMN